MHLRLLYERAAGEESVDGSAIAYVDQINPASLFHPGGEVRRRYPGCEYV